MAIAKTAPSTPHLKRLDARISHLLLSTAFRPAILGICCGFVNEAEPLCEDEFELTVVIGQIPAPAVSYRDASLYNRQGTLL